MSITTQRLTTDGIDLAYIDIGPRTASALLLLHGFPSSSRTFRRVIGALSEHWRVIVPDLPGFGASPPVPAPGFSDFADRIERLLIHLGVDRVIAYLHDFGAPVALHLAARRPACIGGLIVQNANAFPQGLGPQWADTRAFWATPHDAEAAAKATRHLTEEGTRDQYVAGLPPDVASRVDPANWREDWRVMGQPGRLALQRALVLDYGRHVERFPEIAAWLRDHQPPAILLWGRHDPFFELAEILAWMETLPRMEAHVLDGGHFLLETHADEALRLVLPFLDKLKRQ